MSKTKIKFSIGDNEIEISATGKTADVLSKSKNVEDVLNFFSQLCMTRTSELKSLVQASASVMGIEASQQIQEHIRTTKEASGIPDIFEPSEIKVEISTE